MLRGRDIICVSSIDWDTHWQIHHEIMATLAANGNRVLFVENTGVRRPGLGDIGRIRQRIRNWWRGTKGFRSERPTLFVYSPLLLPLPYSRIARRINRWVLLRALRRWMQAVEFGRPIVWTFLPTPLARDIIKGVGPALVVYYCADDFASSSAGARRVTSSEVALLREADVVFATSDRLRERAAEHARSVYRFPAGVRFEAFDRVRTDDAPPPDDVASLPRPILGYVGGLHPSVDQPLLLDVASRMPTASIVLVGPAYADTSALAAAPNIHLLGERPHGDVPRYIKAFDVGLVPYRLNEYTESVYPVKLNEYLAMGIPVVATDLREIRRYNEENGGVVTVASSEAEFSTAIARVTHASSSDDVERRIEAARRNSWPVRMAEMSAILETALAERQKQDERWEERLTRLYRVARRRVLQAVLIVASIYVLLLYTPVVWWIASPLRVEAPPVRADAIVVFAGGVGESGQAGGGYQERVRRAVDLFRDGFAPAMVFSSGYVFAFQEAEIMAALATANGVPSGAIVLETRAANTHDNVVYSAEILRAHHWRRVLLVSSPYHMRRALLTWRRSAPDIDVVPTPVAESQFYLHERGATFEQVGGLAHEAAAIVVYWFKGWI